MTLTPAYDDLHRAHARLYRLGHLQSVADWDQATNMPPRGNDARSAALAELAGLMHEIRTAPALGVQLQAAEQEPLDDDQRANLRELHRGWVQATALPVTLVLRRKMATSRCEHAWRSQRPANDWQGFVGNFRDVLTVAREEAQRLGDALELTPYDALMSRFEPGMTCAKVDEVFGPVRQWLPGLIKAVTQRQASEAVIAPQGPFDVAAQRQLCESTMRLLEFDFEGGRLDVSTHPFCGGVPEDVRMTTRFRSDEFLGSLLGAVHETGHGRYEQNLPRQWLGQPVAEARSMAIHESCSLSFEMQLGCHPGFVAKLIPLIVQALGDQPAFEPGNLQRLFTRVTPGLIRVEADEVTYPAHIILRYEIERALIEGQIEAEDIPALWDAKMMDLLGLDTRGNFKDGPMQDVHWAEGLFGYFPCYSLGAMFAAQWFAAMRRATPALDEQLLAGDFSTAFSWLKDNIWTQASRWTTEELVQRATGEALNPAHFKAHLETRYLGL